MKINYNDKTLQVVIEHDMDVLGIPHKKGCVSDRYYEMIWAQYGQLLDDFDRMYTYDDDAPDAEQIQIAIPKTYSGIYVIIKNDDDMENCRRVLANLHHVISITTFEANKSNVLTFRLLHNGVRFAVARYLKELFTLEGPTVYADYKETDEDIFVARKKRTRNVVNDWHTPLNAMLKHMNLASQFQQLELYVDYRDFLAKIANKVAPVRSTQKRKTDKQKHTDIQYELLQNVKSMLPRMYKKKS